jgi:hypothetical protein
LLGDREGALEFFVIGGRDRHRLVGEHVQAGFDG